MQDLSRRRFTRSRLIWAFGAAGIASLVAFHPRIAAADPALFGIVQPDSLVFPAKINPATGVFTPWGGATFPAGYYAPVYDPVDNAFYVTSSPIGTSTFSDKITRIDGTTGASTVITVNNPFGDPANQNYITGLAFDTATSTLFGIVQPDSLVFPAKINPATGVFTPWGGATFPAGYYAPVYDPVDNAFYVTSSPIGTSTFSDKITRIDGTTGASTVITVNNPFGDPANQNYITGLAVYTSQDQNIAAPEPSTALLFAAAVLGIICVSHQTRASGRKVEGSGRPCAFL